jgi:uncharacterized membrane protein
MVPTAFLFRDAMASLTHAGWDQNRAVAINTSGQVVGWFREGLSERPFLFSAGTFSAFGFGGQARTLNAAGDIVEIASGGHAFLYHAGQVTDLNSQLGLPSSSEATGINAQGVLVGSALRSPGGWTALVPEGYEILYATGINDSGQITATGLDGDQVEAGSSSPRCRPRRTQ